MLIGHNAIGHATELLSFMRCTKQHEEGGLHLGFEFASSVYSVLQSLVTAGDLGSGTIFHAWYGALPLMSQAIQETQMEPHFIIF